MRNDLGPMRRWIKWSIWPCLIAIAFCSLGVLLGVATGLFSMNTAMTIVLFGLYPSCALMIALIIIDVRTAKRR